MPVTETKNRRRPSPTKNGRSFLPAIGEQLDRSRAILRKKTRVEGLPRPKKVSFERNNHESHGSSHHKLINTVNSFEYRFFFFYLIPDRNNRDRRNVRQKSRVSLSYNLKTVDSYTKFDLYKNCTVFINRYYVTRSI